MLKNRIIVCLDLKEGRVVKGVKFKDLIDVLDPVDAAVNYNEQGADELCLLDITASKDSRSILLDIIERITAKCFMPVTVGGGVRDIGDIRNLLRAGADKVSINTAAVNNPGFIQEASKEFGAQCIVVSVDAKRKGSNASSGKWVVCTHGGHKETDIDALEFIKKVESLGAGEILLTSMDCDGTKNGYDLDLTAEAADCVDIPVIASGGVGSLDNLVDGIKLGKASAVLVASLFHFGDHTIREAKEYMLKQGIPIRL